MSLNVPQPENLKGSVFNQNSVSREESKYRSSEKIERVRSNDRYEKYYEQFLGEDLDEESEYTTQSPSVAGPDQTDLDIEQHLR